MKEEKIMLSTKVDQEIFQLMKKLCYLTGLKQYEIMQLGLELVEKEVQKGKIETKNKF